jgi:hypothetical protein
MQSFGKTYLGNPVYKIEVPKDLLTGRAGRRSLFSPNGKLAEFVKKEISPPACVIIHSGEKHTRVVKLCENGMLIPSDMSVIPYSEKKKLVKAGILGKTSIS